MFENLHNEKVEKMQAPKHISDPVNRMPWVWNEKRIACEHPK